jgi:hypothetical protein
MQILAPYDIRRGVDSVYSVFLRERVSANFEEVVTGGFTTAGHESRRHRHLSSLPK